MAKLIAHSSVLTANDTLSGRIVFWTGSDWSQTFGEALRAGDEVLQADLQAAQANVGLVGAYLVQLDATGLPIALREQRRLAGVSVSPPRSAYPYDTHHDFKVAA